MSVIPAHINYYNTKVTVSKEEFLTETWKMDESSDADLKLDMLNFGDNAYLERISRLKEVDRFIDLLKDKSIGEGFPDYMLVLYAEDVWARVQSEYGDSIPVPLVSLGISGTILFTFNHEQHYLELEVTNTCIELFYENEYTGESVFKEIGYDQFLINDVELHLLKIAASI
jgi:hypothetical protein